MSVMITVHDAQLRKVATLDNQKAETLHYTNEKWHRVLETASATFEFTVHKKDVEGDKVFDKVYHHLNEKAYVSFRYKEKNHLFYVAKVVENYRSIQCYCLNLNLDWVNTEVGAYKATRAMSFVEYCRAFGFLDYDAVAVGHNEIADRRRTLSWEGTDSKVARLLSLVRQFDAEIEFDIDFHTDSRVKSFSINVFKMNDEENQGVGRKREDILLVRGKNVSDIKRTVDNSKIYTALTPIGKNGDKTVRLSGSSWSVNNRQGEREFYQRGDTLYAPLAAQRFPSAFSSSKGERWIKKTMEVDSADVSKIRAIGYRELKKYAYPAVEYEVDGSVDLELGDTVRIQDDGFVPTLVLDIRVVEQVICFTNPKQNRTIFGNARALENRVSSDLRSRLETLVNQALPYSIRLVTSHGHHFKNKIGESTVEAVLYKGGVPIRDVTWVWEFMGQQASGQSFLVEGRSVEAVEVLTVRAMREDEELARTSLDFINTNDGAAGKPGLAGADGRTPIIHTAWADSADGSQGFSTTVSTGKAYFGTCTTYSDTNPTGADPTDYRLYKWSQTKGDAGRGIVRVRHYFLVSHLNSGVSVSTSGWTETGQTTSETQRFLWNYTVTEYSDNTSQTSVPIIIGTHGERGQFEGTVGGRNLIPGTATFSGTHWERQGTWRLEDSLYKGAGVLTWVSGPKVSPMGNISVQSGDTYTFSAYIKKASQGTVYFYLYDTAETRFATANVPRETLIQNVGDNFQRFTITFKVTRSGILRPRFAIVASDTGGFSVAGYQLEAGTVATGYAEAPEDIEERFRREAEVAAYNNLRLQEEAQAIRTELEAKAVASEVKQWLAEYQRFSQSADRSIEQLSQSFFTSQERLVAMERDLGENAMLLSFVNTYLRASDDGVTLGNKDHSEYIHLTPQGIQLVSAGVVVATIANGLMKTAHGILTESLQVGNFRFEQSQNNKAVNVWRYVG